LTHWFFHLLVVGLVLITLPGVVETALLTVAFWLAREQTPEVKKRNDAFRLAILVAAHDEEDLIARTVNSLLAACSSETVTVIAHNCSDQTSDRAASAGARVWALTGPQGKGYALEDGFRRLLAEGADAVLVVDADSVVAPGLVNAVKDSLAAGADAVQCRYELQPAENNPRELLRALAFRAFNHLRALGRETLGLSAGIYGCGFALSRRALEAVPYQARSGVEDLEYHLDMTLRGLRVRYLPHVSVWSEVPSSTTGDRTQQARWDRGRRQVAQRYAGRTLGALLRGRWSAVEAWMNAASLPLALQAVALAMLGFAAFFSSQSARTVLLSYVLVGVLALLITLAQVARGYSKSLLWKAAGYVPYFVAVKLIRLPATLRGHRREWVRTERTSQNDQPFPKEK
jgi:cellulose synthase/poly-beta-1,6-N-acetylglucosamine synthase-like glycosyltransferase